MLVRAFFARVAGRSFGVDVRSLAIFRICFGLVILYDIFSRFGDLSAHYTDTGVIPRWTNIRDFAYLTPSVYNISGHWLASCSIFLCTAASAVSLVVGYRTWWNTFICYVLIQSLHARNMRVGNGGDKYLRHMLCWSLFVPLGSVWSIDSLSSVSLVSRAQRIAWWRKHLLSVSAGRLRDVGSVGHGQQSSATFDYSHVSLGSFALLSQTIVMYLVSCSQKDGKEWTDSQTAVYLTLCIDQWVSPIGLFLRGWADQSWMVFRGFQLMTWATTVLQSYGVLLLLSPIWGDFARLMGILVFAGFQLGLGACLRFLCIFPHVTLVGLLPFLPSPFWEAVIPRAVLLYTRTLHGLRLIPSEVGGGKTSSPQTGPESSNSTCKSETGATNRVRQGEIVGVVRKRIAAGGQSGRTPPSSFGSEDIGDDFKDIPSKDKRKTRDDNSRGRGDRWTKAFATAVCMGMVVLNMISILAFTGLVESTESFRQIEAILQINQVGSKSLCSSPLCVDMFF